VKKSWLLAFAALALGCIMALAILEGIVLLAYGQQVRFPRHVVEAPWGLRYNDPGSHYRHKSADGTWWFRINQQGMRDDRDFSYDKHPGVFRIVSLGDSFTIGYEVDADQTFSIVLERELNKAGYDVQVLNAGVSGFSNAEEALYLERELLKYEPDVVVLSFFLNDLTDNVRTGLFRLNDGQLETAAKTYVPAGWLGNFLNSSWFFNLLSERSNAFAFTKERATSIVKAEMVRANEKNLLGDRQARSDHEQLGESPGTESREQSEDHDGERRLAAAIFEHIYELLQERGIPFVIHSIPTELGDELVESFPSAEFDLKRPGIYFVSMRKELLPYLGHQQLYWHRSHFHWTPFSHDKSGRALARIILDNGLLSQD
jgi:lysophospholipase L1-like esterase